MPAQSKAQRRLMAIAKHNPTKVSADNKGVLSMDKKLLEDFIATPEKGLPQVKEPKGMSGIRTRRPKNGLLGGLATLKGVANTRRRTL